MTIKEDCRQWLRGVEALCCIYGCEDHKWGWAHVNVWSERVEYEARRENLIRNVRPYRARPDDKCPCLGDPLWSEAEEAFARRENLIRIAWHELENEYTLCYPRLL